MESHDHRKINPPVAGHEHHICHKCGWSFPNTHPSAKHRRAHKKVCGTIEGFKVLDSEEKTHLGGSDEDQHSDEDHKVHEDSKLQASSSIEREGSEIPGEYSNKSEDEVFTDAVAEFGDTTTTGISAIAVDVEDVNGERSAAKDLDRCASSKDINYGNTIEPPNHPAHDKVQNHASISNTGSIAAPILDKATETLINASAATNAHIGENEIVMSMDIIEHETNVSENEKQLDENLPGMPSSPSKLESEVYAIDSKLQKMDGFAGVEISSMDRVEDSKETDTLGQKHSGTEASPDIFPSCRDVETGHDSGAFVGTTRVEADTEVKVEKNLSENFGGTTPDIVEGTNVKASDNMPEFPVHTEVKVEKISEEKFDDCLDHKIPVSEESQPDIHSIKSYEPVNVSDSHIQVLEDNPQQEGTDGKNIVKEVLLDCEVDIPEVKAMISDGFGSDGLVIEDSGVDSCNISGHYIGEVLVEENSTIKAVVISEPEPRDFGYDLSEKVLAETLEMSEPDGDAMVSCTDSVVHDAANIGTGNNSSAHEEARIDHSNISEEFSREVPKEKNSTIKQEPHDSLYDLSEKIPPETLVVIAAGVDAPISSAEAKVHEAHTIVGSDNIVANEEGRIDNSNISELSSGEVPKEENSTIKAEVQPQDFRYDLLEKVLSETLEVVEAGGDATYSSKDAEVREASNVSGGDSNVLGHYHGEIPKKENSTSKNVALSEHSYGVSEAKPQIHADNGMDESQKNLHETGHKENITEPDLQDCQERDFQESLRKLEVGGDSVPSPVKAGQILGTPTDGTDTEPRCEEPELNNGSHVGSSVIGAENLVSKEKIPSEVMTESSILSSVMVDDGNAKILGGDVADINGQSLGEAGDDNLLKPQLSIDFSSQPDSIEGCWGSVSDGTVPSTGAQAPGEEKREAPLKKVLDVSVEHHSNANNDIIKAPSSMTLIELGRENDQKAASSEMESNSSSSLTHVVNESQGRKKNEEVIAKVENWSPGKPHTPLGSLLVKANDETKDKAVPQTMAPEVSSAPASKVNTGKEWNSPARLPERKLEKRKERGKSYWVPFVCCSSIQ